MPDVSGLSEARLCQFFLYIEIILFGFFFLGKQVCNFLFVKSGKGDIKIGTLQCFDFHTQKLFVPSGIHCHPVICNDIGFLLSGSQMINEYTGNFRDVLTTCSKHSAVSGNDVIVTVDDDRIDEPKLPQRGTQFVDLLRGVGSCIICIRDQLIDADELHIRCRSHHTSPHSANFSKPPMDWM